MITPILRGICLNLDRLVTLSGKAASLLMPVLAFIVAFEVFSRYILNNPTIWAFDLSLFMFGYVAALGGAYAQLKRAHINVDILYVKVSRKVRSWFNLVSFSFGIFFLLIIIQLCFGKYEEAVDLDYRRESEWAPPMFHFWIMMMIASGLFVAQLSRDILVEIYFLLTSKDLIEEESSDGN